MNIQKITKTALLTALVALGGAQCWGAASNPDSEKQNLSQQIEQAAINGNAAAIQQLTTVAMAANTITGENVLDQMPNEIIVQIAGSLDQTSLLKLAQVSKRTRKVVQIVPLYQSTLQQLHHLLKQHNGNAQEALFDAAINNKPWAINYLVQNGADVNAKDDFGRTALMIAAPNGYGAVVAQLIVAGANINARDNCNDTALIGAALNGHEAIVTQLITVGADVNAKNNKGMTALMLVSFYGREAAATQLIAAGVDVNAKNKDGYTALKYTNCFDQKTVANLLIEAGARG